MFIDVGKLGKTASFLSLAFKRCDPKEAYTFCLHVRQETETAVNYYSFLSVHGAERLSLTVGKLYNDLV